MRRLLFVNFVLFGPTIRRWMHRRRRNQRGVEVLLCVLFVLLRRVFYAHKREREGEARFKRFERETWLRDATETRQWDEEDKEEEVKEEEEREHSRWNKGTFRKAQAYICVQTPANAPTKVAEDVKSILLNRVVEHYILRFFCDDATTSFAFDFHKIFSQTNFSLSLSSLWLSRLSRVSAMMTTTMTMTMTNAFCERW